MPPHYPDAAARRLLLDHLGQSPASRIARNQATKRLLEQFALLLAKYGVKYQVANDTVGIVVHAPRGQMAIVIDESLGRLLVGPVSLSAGPVPLFFNPDTGLFEGVDVDPDVAPVPGQLRERRSGLAVLVGAVFGNTPPVVGQG